MKKLSWILLSVLLILTAIVIGYFEINGPEEWDYQTPSSSIVLTPIPGLIPTPVSTNVITLIPTSTVPPLASYPPANNSNGGH